MSIESISAKFECDDCGSFFTVDLDAAYKPPKNWCLMAAAEDQIRAGLNSTEDGYHYCKACTAKRDTA